MATSYPRNRGIWRVTDVAKNLLEHGTWPGSPVPGTRGLAGGGKEPGTVGTIDQITISTTGDASDFGDLSVARIMYAGSGGGNFTRGLFGPGGNPGISNTVDYVTFSSTGNAADFGDLSQSRYFCP